MTKIRKTKKKVKKTHRKPEQLVYRVVLSVKEPYDVTDKLITSQNPT